MRAILHIGTRGCSTALADALRDHLGPVVVLVPAEPALLGPALDADALEEEAVLLAHLVLSRAIDQAYRARENAQRELARVFEAEPTAGKEAVTGDVVDPPLVERLPDTLRANGVGEVWMSREALELFDQAQVDVAQAVTEGGAELEAR